ncbi:prepilin-type N-terminal cleavage/methylation domain-containing protein, partial [bacterium]|nr:prepilin-type N-terminal cleavage/methylation domain-containing protein [bacterium]
MNSMRKRLAFSLIELLISLIAISCITAAFAPVISKRLTSGALSIGAGEVKVTSGNFLPIPECHEKYGSLCNLCGPEGCYGCSKTCQDGEYINVSKCTCTNCEDNIDGYDANCIKCDGEKCFQCSNGYYLVNQSKKCKICPAGYYC